MYHYSVAAFSWYSWGIEKEEGQEIRIMSCKYEGKRHKVKDWRQSQGFDVCVLAFKFIHQIKSQVGSRDDHHGSRSGHSDPVDSHVHHKDQTELITGVPIVINATQGRGRCWPVSTDKQYAALSKEKAQWSVALDITPLPAAAVMLKLLFAIFCRHVKVKRMALMPK